MSANDDKEPSSSLMRGTQRIGVVGLISLIVLTSIMTPLAIDMYLPAVPAMTSYFDTSAPIVNLTLILYQLFFSFGMVVFGVVSDKYGRKPVLVIGLLAYALGSIGAGLSTKIQMLVLFRIFQGIGAGAASTVSTAMVKDCFVARVREKVLVLVQAMFVVGPVLAPLIGGQLLVYFSWRATFWTLTVIGILCLILAAFFQESLPPSERYEGTALSSFKHLVTVGSNKGFLFLLIPMALNALYFMAYVSCSSYIFIDFFGVSAQGFSVYFAALAAFSVVGSLAYLVLSKFLSYRFITNLLLGILLASSVVLLIFGQMSPFVFFLCFLPAYLVSAVIRPYMTGILLNQQAGNTGAASSLINFSITVCGVIGMSLAMLPWTNYVIGLGIITLVSGLVILGFWIFLMHSKVECKGLK